MCSTRVYASGPKAQQKDPEQQPVCSCWQSGLRTITRWATQQLYEPLIISSQRKYVLKLSAHKWWFQSVYSTNSSLEWVASALLRPQTHEKVFYLHIGLAAGGNSCFCFWFSLCTNKVMTCNLITAVSDNTSFFFFCRLFSAQDLEEVREHFTFLKDKTFG